MIPVVTVQAGDTLSGIAQAYGTTWEALFAANPKIKDPNLIYPGEKVDVVKGKSGGSDPASVTVRSGQTMWGIASGLGVSLTSLETANPQVQDPDYITIGEVLSAPGGSSPQLDSYTASVPDPTPAPVSSSGGSTSDASDAFPGAACIVAAESGGNPEAVNAYSGASGLFQDLPSTWDDYDGYAEASDAPVSVQIAFNIQLSGDGTNLTPWAADGCPGT